MRQQVPREKSARQDHYGRDGRDATAPQYCLSGRVYVRLRTRCIRWLSAGRVRLLERNLASSGGGHMRRETIAVHGGYEVEPTTKAVAVPIYQTVAYAFDSADHGAALFNLEVEGFRYSRISKPNTEVLEGRVTAIEGGRGVLWQRSGQAELSESY